MTSLGIGSRFKANETVWYTTTWPDTWLRYRYQSGQPRPHFQCTITACVIAPVYTDVWHTSCRMNSALLFTLSSDLLSLALFLSPILRSARYETFLIAITISLGNSKIMLSTWSWSGTETIFWFNIKIFQHIPCAYFTMQRRMRRRRTALTLAFVNAYGIYHLGSSLSRDPASLNHAGKAVLRHHESTTTLTTDTTMMTNTTWILIPSLFYRWVVLLASLTTSPFHWIPLLFCCSLLQYSLVLLSAQT